MEGKRLVEEYSLKRFQHYIDIYISLSIDDFNWLVESKERRSLVILSEREYLDDGTPILVDVVRFEKGGQYPQQALKRIDIIDYLRLSPFQMSHLRGGGHQAMVEDSFNN